MPELRQSAAYAVGLEGVDLVFHQSYEGGDDEGQAGQGDGGELVAEGLAAAGGHDDEGVAAVHDGVDYLGLERSEAGRSRSVF